MIDAEGLKVKKAQRFTYLETLYRMADGSTLAFVRESDVNEELGLDEKTGDVISVYLRDEGLLEFAAMGVLSITHGGVREIEYAIESPDSETEHFPPATFTHSTNIWNIGSMTDSSIQQGTIDSQQAVLNAVTVVTELAEAFSAAADAEDDPARKSKLRATAETLAGAGRDVATHYIEKTLGL